MTAIVISPCVTCGGQPVYSFNSQKENETHGLKCEKGHCVCGGLKYDELVLHWNMCQMKNKNEMDKVEE